MHKDQLEDFIHQNRKDFDDQEPDPHIWDNILNDLDKKPLRRLPWKAYALRAASVAVIFAMSWIIHDMVGHQKQDNQNILAESQAPSISAPAQELLEAEAFYTSRINELQAEVSRFDKIMPGVGMEMNIELKDLDSAYAGLKRDLRDNAANEEIISAMIQNYRIRISILEDLLLQVSTSNSEDNNNKEVSYEL